MKHKDNGRPYVIKRMSKADLSERRNSVDARIELDFLKQASQSPLYDGRPAPGITALHVWKTLTCIYCRTSRAVFLLRFSLLFNQSIIFFSMHFTIQAISTLYLITTLAVIYYHFWANMNTLKKIWRGSIWQKWSLQSTLFIAWGISIAILRYLLIKIGKTIIACMKPFCKHINSI